MPGILYSIKEIIVKNIQSIEVRNLHFSMHTYQFVLNDLIKAGRPKTNVSEDQINQVITLLQQGNSVNSISNNLGISKRQIYKIIDNNGLVVQKHFDQ